MVVQSLAFPILPSLNTWFSVRQISRQPHEYLCAKDIPVSSTKTTSSHMCSLITNTTGVTSHQSPSHPVPHVHPKLPFACSRHVLKMYCPCAEDRYRQENLQHSGRGIFWSPYKIVPARDRNQKVLVKATCKTKVVEHHAEVKINRGE